MSLVKLVGLAVMLSIAGATGCAVHSQAPIKEVAYDFSDADFYDRAYAPSPDYGPRVPELAPAPAVIDVGALPPGQAVEVPSEPFAAAP